MMPCLQSFSDAYRSKPGQLEQHRDHKATSGQQETKTQEVYFLTKAPLAVVSVKRHKKDTNAVHALGCLPKAPGRAQQTPQWALQ